MKKEIKLILENGSFDMFVENGDFANEPGFDTAIWVSLFTDARADSAQVVIPENRRGWLGNTVSEVSDRHLGGYLWLTEQRRLNQDTLNEVIDYIRKSLNWLIEDGAAIKIDVLGDIVPRQGIEAQVKITALDGVTSDHFIQLWKVTGDAN